ncbi:Helix-turn-helix [Rhodoferax sp. OV413]|uniref:helix-turn-helix domain-containing protein n=1 Tax=Rhodoferax sp. OV413 TaxID=1855285 RepID=UPI000880A211|nr:helix-turn-helix transcriptional regulator [Rhodoferax sp. OV413]SDP83606.1 Helix-turn-helix [Rhodoferax sp. OV413]
MKKQEKVPDARALLAANVLKHRMQLGVSQEKLAEMAGFHRTYVSQVERRVANATTDNVQKLADVLSVPVAQLFEVPSED